MEDTFSKVYEYIATYGLNIVAALIIFFVGRWLAKIVSKLLAKLMAKADLDEALVQFVENLCYIGLLVFIIIAALAKLGIQTASFIAVLGAAGLAVGLALQGSLANFASGVLMLIFKPFKIGDFVEAAGITGTVKQIQIFNTILFSPDNVRIIIPNAQITASNIKNYTANGTRRVDLAVGISYEDDFKKAKEVIQKVLENDNRILKDPPATVAVSELGESSVNFVVRPWAKSSDYWDVYFDITAKIKLSLDENNITIPFPQQDVHIKNAGGKETAFF